MNNQFLWLGSGFITFCLSFIFVRLFCNYAVSLGLIDIPNNRSSHHIATPRGAGIVFVLLWIGSMTVALISTAIPVTLWLLLVPATILVSLLGFWDDYKTLSPKIRLWIQIIAAFSCVFLLGGTPILHLLGPESLYLGWLGSLIAILWIVWSVNLFNFMDGIDGLASVEALFVLSMGGLLFWLKTESFIAFIPWMMCMAVAGFLVWNWPKARVFMGDAGSYCLGFLVAVLSLMGDIVYQIPITLWLILYGVFWFDATVTLIRRIYLKKHWATAHRDHAYQRLYLARFSHQQILIKTCLLNLILGLLTVWTFYHPEWILGSMLFTCLMLTIDYCLVERLKPMTKDLL